MGSSRATGEGNPVVTAKKIAPWVIEHTANDQQADLLVVLVDHNEIIADPVRRSVRPLFLSRGLHDLSEAARVETGAADEGAVDVWLGH